MDWSFHSLFTYFKVCKKLHVLQRGKRENLCFRPRNPIIWRFKYLLPGFTVAGCICLHRNIQIRPQPAERKRFNSLAMAIIVNLDVMMAKRKISLNDLAEKVEITPVNLSILKTGKAKAIRFSTLDAICKALDCQPGDILEYQREI